MKQLVPHCPRNARQCAKVRLEPQPERTGVGLHAYRLCGSFTCWQIGWKGQPVPQFLENVLRGDVSQRFGSQREHDRIGLPQHGETAAERSRAGPGL